MSKWTEFRDKWCKGCGSDQCPTSLLTEKARNVVLCKGHIPCDVLFVGEAPGESEDVLSIPFVGPAGHLLDTIIEQASVNLPSPLRHTFTNLVCCIPRKGDGDKAGEPEAPQIRRCGGRLSEFLTICSPKLLVCVGRLAETWLNPKHKPRIVESTVPRVSIVHPAAILRASVAQQGLAVKRCILTLQRTFEALATEKL